MIYLVADVGREGSKCCLCAIMSFWHEEQKLKTASLLNATGDDISSGLKMMRS